MELQVSPGISAINVDICNKEPNSIFNITELNKIVADLNSRNFDLFEMCREKEARASDFENVLKCVWLNLCDAYERKSSIKEVSIITLHNLYHQLETYITCCSDYGDRDLTRKIKKEIEQMRSEDSKCTHTKYNF